MFITELFGNLQTVHKDCRLGFKWTAQQWYGQMNLVALQEISLEGKILIPRRFLFPKTRWGLTFFRRLSSEPPEIFYPQRISWCNKSKHLGPLTLGLGGWYWFETPVWPAGICLPKFRCSKDVCCKLWSVSLGRNKGSLILRDIYGHWSSSLRDDNLVKQRKTWPES